MCQDTLNANPLKSQGFCVVSLGGFEFGYAVTFMTTHKKSNTVRKLNSFVIVFVRVLLFF